MSDTTTCTHELGDYDETCPTCVALAATMNDESVTEIVVTTSTGRKNFTHGDCVHDRTPAGRALCRAAGGPEAYAVIHGSRNDGRVAAMPTHARVSANAAAVHRLGTETNAGFPVCGTTKFNPDTAIMVDGPTTCKNCIKTENAA
jgi:hypothetical protein